MTSNFARAILSTVILAAAGCKPTSVAPKKTNVANHDSAITNPAAPFAYGVTVFVSAVNCEMNVADAVRLNRLASETGITVEVAFVGVAAGDTLIVQQARKDLGLNMPSRFVRDGELARYKSIGIARLPMALVIKGKQLSTIVSGETVPKTIGLIEAAFSPKVGH